MPVITISGLPGAGTTTVARLVSEAVGLERVDGGTLFRTLATQRGIDVVELSIIAESDPGIDLEVDQRLASRAREGDVVLESRLAGWIVTKEGLEATRVWIEAAERERARRVAVRESIDFDRALKANRVRESSERRRYLAYYGMDLDDRSIYDLVIDSTRLVSGAVAQSILQAVSGLM